MIDTVEHSQSENDTKPISEYEKILRDFSVARVRHLLNLTQADCATRYNVSVSTFRKWEDEIVTPRMTSGFKRILDTWLALNHTHRDAVKLAIQTVPRREIVSTEV